MNLFDFRVVWRDLFEIIGYLPITIGLSAASALIGLILGLLVAVIKLKKVKILSQIVTFYISFVRGTPIIVQLYISYFGIPILMKYVNYYFRTNLNITGIPPILFAITALGLNSSAYFAVTIKASLESVNKGQIEAAYSLGLSYGQTLQRIIIPEAVEVAVPSLGNSLIGLVKGTSLAFTCAVVEMAAQGKIIAGRDYRYFESYVALAIIYWGVTIAIEYGIKLIQLKIKIPDTVPEHINLIADREVSGGYLQKKKFISALNIYRKEAAHD